MIGSKWRHKKRGTTYEIITDTASLQHSSEPQIEDYFEDVSLMVYRNTVTGAIYIRPVEEFMDGRFEKISDE